MIIENALIAAAIAYLLGSIPFGLILTRLVGVSDIRAIGSGNIGATNVLRTGRKDIAVLTLLLDTIKGTAAIVLAEKVFSINEPILLYLIGLAAIMGHIFPIWLKFKGGKGVATALGVILALNWLIALIMVAIWSGVAKIGRISSLSALIAFAMGPVVAWFIEPEMASFMLVILFLIIHTHRYNILRLIRGEEAPFKAKR